VIANIRVGGAPGLARVSEDGKVAVSSNRADGTISIIDTDKLVVRATVPVCDKPEDLAILPDASKVFVDLKTDRLLTLLQVGNTPVHLAMKPDGGEIFVCNFDSSSVSVIETGANEIGQTFLIGTNPARAIVTDDNNTLLVSNFGSNSLSVYAIDIGRVLGELPTGAQPDSLALTGNQKFVLVADSLSGDVTVLRLEKLPSGSKISAQRALTTMIPVGASPNAIVIKAFTTK